MTTAGAERAAAADVGHVVYVTSRYSDRRHERVAVLKCAAHPDWEADVDGDLVAQVVAKTREHTADNASEQPAAPAVARRRVEDR